MKITWLLLILAGLFSMCGAGFDWDWFMENRKARMMSELLGDRSRARVFYLILGLAILAVGFLGAFGVLDA